MSKKKFTFCKPHSIIYVNNLPVEREKEMKSQVSGRKVGKIIGILAFLFAAVLFAVAFSACLYLKSVYPDSVDTDTFGHLFKSNYLHHSLKKGVIYPIYTECWYNGMELFRYWPPAAYYVVALLQFCTGGNVLNAFYVFAGVVYLINMVGWFLLGKREDRLGLAFLVGNLYFFCPDNFRIFIAEGNIPRIFITSLLPFVFCYVWEIIHYKNLKKLIGLAIVIWLITLTHFMIAAMTGISIFIFCLIYELMNRQWQGIVIVTVDLVLAYLASGIFLLPGLTGGGLTSQDSEASVNTISQWAQEALKSLNPLYRVDGGYERDFYFGIVIFVIAILGVIAANKRTGSGFITTLFIFASTTTVASSVVRLLPMSQVFWMQRFVPMAMCIFFLTLILWKELKKSVILIFTILMLVDSVSTVVLLAEPKEQTIAAFMEEEMSQYLLPEAMELTENRLGIVDNSMWGAIPSYYLSQGMDESNVIYSFGWAYQGAKTIDNIVSINEATQKGFYEYAFDRLLELGDDTLLVDKDMIPASGVSDMKSAAEALGYKLYDENENVWLYHLEGADGTFGIVKNYTNLAIGKHARTICYLYPEFGYGNSTVIEDYSTEELMQYEKLYLSGFTYRDKATAESMLRTVADSGVKIYIEMQHIPMNKLSGKAEFFDVYAQYVAFTEKFPIISTNNGSQFKLDFRTAGYAVWNTVYLSGASENVKNAYYDNVTSLTYVARNNHPNITFLGFNPVYYYFEDRKPELLTFLNETFEEEPGQISESILVPVDVIYEADRITVYTESDGVNTGIADLECFVLTGGNEKESDNNLLTVDSGTTVFEVEYTDLLPGAAVSCVGVLGSIVYWMALLIRRKETTGNESAECDNNMCINAGNVS